jgi:para-aminobenzoate synthetase / 4-amino-4-deoxychorismate lyase
LEQSAKDRAENVMIVDLLRNDLGRVAVSGSVKVSKLFEIERYETLWQMTSTVEATLRDDIGLTELMRGLFPCGSITGAPKVRTMEIIRELEPFPRGAYTGTLGFLRPGGDAIFNVAIRTVVIDSELGEATFGVGGGITYDSTAEREYEECLVKSSFLNAAPVSFQLLESILLEDGDYFLLRRHLERMKSSADYFGCRFAEGVITAELRRVAAGKLAGRWKIRLLSSRNGELQIEALELDVLQAEPLRVGLATEPVNSNNKFLFHKTTNRKVYENALASRPDCEDVILWNEEEEVTESTVANVVVSIGGELFTPPQTAGLLAGTFREELLLAGKIRERVIHRNELQRAGEFFLINSVQKWRQAVLV